MATCFKGIIKGGELKKPAILLSHGTFFRFNAWCFLVLKLKTNPTLTRSLFLKSNPTPSRLIEFLKSKPTRPLLNRIIESIFGVFRLFRLRT